MTASENRLSVAHDERGAFERVYQEPKLASHQFTFP